MGKDTHALSAPAQRTALEVLAANDIVTIIQRDDGFTPTPVISHAILVHNRGRGGRLADGIVITPSHNPPEDGGLKYNPTNGGPADTDVTRWIEHRANELLCDGNVGVRRVEFNVALTAETTRQDDLVLPYVDDLRYVIDMDAVRDAGCRSPSTRSVARRWRIGSRSTGSTASTSSSPTRSSIRPSHS